MASTIFPIPGLSTLNADSYTVPAAYKEYKVIKNFDAAVYQVTTSPTNSQATVTFFGSSSAPQTTTISGTVTFNLEVPAVDAAISISSGSNTVVTINKVASALTGAEFAGTLDTITSTGTYNQTGKLYVMTVGGGGGGGDGTGGPGNGATPGRGGGRGDIGVKVLVTTTATTATIGTGGTRVGVHNSNAGGTTSFGNFISSSGGAGTSAGGNNPYGSGSNTGNAATANASLYTTIKSGTNGGGGWGAQSYNQNATQGPESGTGDGGIGTGGNGGNAAQGVGGAGNAGTGYGSGGGGGGGASNGGYQNGNGTGGSGGAGAPGVIYVLRGI